MRSIITCWCSGVSAMGWPSEVGYSISCSSGMAFIRADLPDGSRNQSTKLRPAQRRLAAHGITGLMGAWSPEAPRRLGLPEPGQLLFQSPDAILGGLPCRGLLL